jgi:hypothetical protein
LNELSDLVITCHQFFFALLVCTFAFFLVTDLKSFADKWSSRERGFLVLFFSIFTMGTFYLFYSDWDQKGIFFAFEFSILVTCSLIHPKYAVSFLVYLMLSRPWESYDSQMMISMPRDISYLAIISVIAHKVFRKEYYFRFNFGTFALLAFAAWLFGSGFLSDNADEALTKFFEIFMKGVILFILIQNGLEKVSDIWPVKTAFVLAILEKCFVSLYKSKFMNLPTIVDDGNTRLESVGILTNSNDIAAIFVLAIPFTVYLILKSNLKPFNWIVAFLSIALMSFLVWESQSRGALLGLFAIFGAFALIKIKSKRLMMVALSLGIVGTFGAFSLMNRDAEDVEGSTSNRKIYWKAGLNMALRNPAFGVGFWGFPKNLPAYVDGGDVGSEKENMTAHSSWVLALGEGGFLALFFFLALWVYAAFGAWKIRLEQPEYLMGIAGYGMCMTFLSHTYLLYPYILLSIVITHYQIENGLILQKG